MQEIRQLYNNILTMVEKKVFDSYLLKYIQKPVIDEDKLLIIISIMARLEQSEKEIQNIALSTMLIQIALDTHEHITESVQEDKNRQLTVLAGDYFSGLYYKFLADSSEIAMIRALSYGVKEVNEHKVFMYQNHAKLDQLFYDLKMIESSLIRKVADYFNMQQSFEIISDYLFFNRLLREKQIYLENGPSLLSEKVASIININHKDYQRAEVFAVFDSYLDSLKETITQGISRIPYLNNFLENQIVSVLNQHQTLVKTFVEEG